MCELIGIEIMRCEFGKAEEGLEDLIGFLRQFDGAEGFQGLWDSFSPRVTLYYAYLAHAKGDGDEACEEEDVDQKSKGRGKSKGKAKEGPESEPNLSRALRCYRVAEMIAMERGDEWVATAARAGSIGVRIGMKRKRSNVCTRNQTQTMKTETKIKGKGKGKERARDDDRMDIDIDDEEDELSSFSDHSRSRSRDKSADVDVEMDIDVDMDMDNLEDDDAEAQVQEDQEEWDEIVREGHEVAERCRGLGGTMWSVGQVIEASLSEEIITAKQYLRAAVERLSASGDNHLRTLVMALIASHYFHTSMDTAVDLLAAAENLGAGMGAGVKKSKKNKEAPGHHARARPDGR
ncbi:hypothetical protein D9758_013385 [Tetrapyrgos nigripes]|uniref:Uncharacterized protein n=1 Tax=Tetrapyrgos nigripes TaxID=182062 RepID=A0A8H5CJE1_9AGAR|nr:hypothetical protein D9758_013385 [Tetrapyrgos nigripes]